MKMLQKIVLSLLVIASPACLQAKDLDYSKMNFTQLQAAFASMDAYSQDTVIKASGCNPEAMRDSAGNMQQLMVRIALACGLRPLKQSIITHKTDKHSGYALSAVAEQGTIVCHFMNRSDSLFIYIMAHHAYDPHTLAEYIRRTFNARKLRVEVTLR
jgi:hypothetical protein